MSWDLLESVFFFPKTYLNCSCKIAVADDDLTLHISIYYIMHKPQLKKLIHDMQFALTSLTMELIGKKCKAVLNLETNMTDL